ncbi:MAG: hypothetical protein EDQ89_11615 [Acidobacteria bacterium]|nr:MAG: hypothetical protein EDQ89_11615 [Acidobacteriota bacterium]GIK78405.1 MAG: hypothetical protein BroJett022_20950 [Actinomycetes bacterium]
MSVAERARRWHHRRQARFCDVVRPWAHGTVLRATRLPDIPPGMDLDGVGQASLSGPAPGGIGAGGVRSGGGRRPG